MKYTLALFTVLFALTARCQIEYVINEFDEEAGEWVKVTQFEFVAEGEEGKIAFSTVKSGDTKVIFAIASVDIGCAGVPGNQLRITCASGRDDFYPDENEYACDIYDSSIFTINPDDYRNEQVLSISLTRSIDQIHGAWTHELSLYELFRRME